MSDFNKLVGDTYILEEPKLTTQSYVGLHVGHVPRDTPPLSSCVTAHANRDGRLCSPLPCTFNRLPRASGRARLADYVTLTEPESDDWGLGTRHCGSRARNGGHPQHCRHSQEPWVDVCAGRPLLSIAHSTLQRCTGAPMRTSLDLSGLLTTRPPDTSGRGMLVRCSDIHVLANWLTGMLYRDSVHCGPARLYRSAVCAHREYMCPRAHLAEVRLCITSHDVLARY